MGFRLTIEQGQGQGKTYDLGDKGTIGRAEGNDVVISDPAVSRNHASIARESGRWVLRDAGTAIGTLLNGSRVEREVLENGDVVAIGSVLLRFEDPTEGRSSLASSTRIVSAHGDTGGTRPGLTQGTNPSIAAGGVKALSGKRPLKPVIGVLVALIVVGAVAVYVLQGSGGSGRKDRCPPEIALKEGIRDFSFGEGVQADCQAGDVLTFTFTHTARSRALFTYAPFHTEVGELGLYLNDVKVADVPPVRTQHAIRQELALPDRLIAEGANNTVQFRFEGGDGADGMWGVKLVDIELIGLDQADLAKAQQAYKLGERRYKERNIAAPNLFLAWEYLRDARRYMEGLEPKPGDYEPTLALIRDVEKELDKLCRERLFAARIEAKYNRFDKANDIYKFLLLAFPDDRHECRQQALDSMWVDE